MTTEGVDLEALAELASGLGTTVGTLAVVLLLWARVRVAPRGRWGLVDAAMALGALLWLSGWAGLVLHRVSAGTWLPGANGNELSLAHAALGTALGGAAAVLFAWRRAGRAGLGLRCVQPRWFAIALLMLPPFLLFSAGWITALEVMGVAEVEQEVLTRLKAGPRDAAAVGVLVYGVAVAPVLEELLFRGFAQPAFVTRFGAAAGIGSTALLFGALHAADPAAVVPLIVLGIALGWLRWRSESCLPAVLLHFANNAVALAATMVAQTA